MAGSLEELHALTAAVDKNRSKNQRTVMSGAPLARRAALPAFQKRIRCYASPYVESLPVDFDVRKQSDSLPLQTVSPNGRDPRIRIVPTGSSVLSFRARALPVCAPQSYRRLRSLESDMD